MWLITILSLIGVVLNIYKRQECFIIWSVTNLAWMIYDWNKGLKEQAVLFGVYLILALWGLYTWQKKGKQQTKEAVK